jgi:hypothetical protein
MGVGGGEKTGAVLRMAGRGGGGLGGRVEPSSAGWDAVFRSFFVPSFGECELRFRLRAAVDWKFRTLRVCRSSSVMVVAVFETEGRVVIAFSHQVGVRDGVGE